MEQLEFADIETRGTERPSFNALVARRNGGTAQGESRL